MAKRGPRPKFGLNQIQEAARTIILSEGLEGLTMSRLAKALATSPSSLYRYYPSKEALIVELQVQAIGEIESALLERLESFKDVVKVSESSHVLALRRCMVAFDVYANGASSAGRGLIDAFLSQPKPFLSITQAQEVNLSLSRVLNLCVQTLDDAVRLKAIRTGDNVQRTHLIWAALHGLGQFRKRDRIQPVNLQAASLKTALYVTFFGGFGAKEDVLEQALAVSDSILK